MIGLALFVFRRPEHTIRVLESIKKNGFEKIYIFQDGLKDKKDKSDWEAVNNIIKNVKFADVELHISAKNKGLANSIVDGMSYVFERHETAIALEDDIVLLDGYKKYMEACFKTYANNHKIFSISGGACGVVVPNDYEYDSFLSYRMFSCGLGTWKDRWTGFRRDPKIYKYVVANPKMKKHLKLSGGDIEGIFRDDIAGNADSWAVYWQMYLIYNLAYHVAPSYDYVTDIGRDGSGTNTRNYTDKYQEYRFGHSKDKYNLVRNKVVDQRIVRDVLVLFNGGEKKRDRIRLGRDFLLRYVPALIFGGKIKKYLEEHNISEIYFAGGGRLDYYTIKKLRKYVKIRGVASNDLEIKELINEKYTIVTLRRYYYEYVWHLNNKFKSSAKIIYLKEML